MNPDKRTPYLHQFCTAPVAEGGGVFERSLSGNQCFGKPADMPRRSPQKTSGQGLGLQ